MKIWSYIEAHHEELGVALFILPVSMLGLLVAGIAQCASLLLR